MKKKITYIVGIFNLFYCISFSQVGIDIDPTTSLMFRRQFLWGEGTTLNLTNGNNNNVNLGTIPSSFYELLLLRRTVGLIIPISTAADGQVQQFKILQHLILLAWY
jgi:hypothetical protein